MDTNNLMKTVIGVIISAVLLTALLIPSLSIGVDATRTYSNDGPTYAEFDNEEHTIVLARDSSGNLTITTDDEVCENPDFSLYNAATLVYGSDGMLRLTKGTGANDNLHIFTDSSAYLALGVGETVTVTVSDTGATMVKGSTTKSGTFTPLAYIASEGDYTLCANPCVLADSAVIIAGQTVIDSSNAIIFYANGELDNLTVTSGYVVSADSLTVSSVEATVNTSEVDGDLLQIDSIVFTAKMSDDSEWTGTYTYFLAPTEITYDNPQYVGSDLAALLNIIPLLVLVGLVLGVVGAVLARRD